MSGEVKRRRSSTEARQALIDAAGGVFGRHGYGGASTKEIARVARTSETVIYSQFGSKAELFRCAVLEPFGRFVTQFTADFTKVMAHGRDDEQFMRAFVTDLYDQLRAHRDAVRALISASGEPDADEAVGEAIDRMRQMFDELAELSAKVWHAGGGFDLENIPTVHRLIHGMLVSATVFEPLYRSADARYSDRDHVIDTATNLLLHGIGGPRPGRRQNHECDTSEC